MIWLMLKYLDCVIYTCILLLNVDLSFEKVYMAMSSEQFLIYPMNITLLNIGLRFHINFVRSCL